MEVEKMDGLSLSAWLTMIFAFALLYGGVVYSMLLAWGKKPDVVFQKLGVSKLVSYVGKKAEDLGIYKPFEYMDRGPKEKALATLFVLILLIVGWKAGVFEEEIEASYSGVAEPNYIISNSNWSAQGETSEGDVSEVEHQFKGRVWNATFVLEWTDDDTTEGNIGGTGVQNQPDKFRLTVVTPNGTEYSKEAENDVVSEKGVIRIEVVCNLTEKEEKEKTIEDFEAGNWTIKVECVEAGDSTDNFGNTWFQDDGNSWSLSVEYSYYEKKPLL